MKTPEPLFIRRLTASLVKTEEILLAFLSGSNAKRVSTRFSDIDIWIVFREERDLNYYLRNIPNLFVGCGVIRSIEECTPTHFFVHFTDGSQVDLNMTTTASYFSLTGTNHHLLLDRTLKAMPPIAPLPVSLLTHGVAILERAGSKYVAGKYTLVPRFAASFREQVLIPLLAQTGCPSVIATVDFEISQAPAKLQSRIIDCFPKPTKSETLLFIMSAISLLEELVGPIKTPQTTKQLKALAQLGEIETK